MTGGGVLYNNSVWLYPDLETLMVGTWDEAGLMEWGRAGRVTGVHCNSDGVMVLQTEEVEGSKTYKYDPPSQTKISSNPLDTDQYEVKHISVRKSKYASSIMPR